MKNKKTLNVYGELIYENTRYICEDNPWDHWQHMPNYVPRKTYDSYCDITIEFSDDSEVNEFGDMIDQKFTEKTKSAWFPIFDKHKTKYRYFGDYNDANYPKYPIYIVSKGRWDKRLTSDTLINLKIKHYIIVESSQYDLYKSKVDENFVTILTLPQEYLDNYDTCDDLGNAKSKGPGAARNYAWDHSISLGYERHWVMDDNQQHFFRHDENRRTITNTGAIFRAMEDHTDRYKNCYISGPHYRFFVVPGENVPPFVQNCRIYSCLLIKNDIPYRWRGRYNEDTDLSLRVLKDGYCTIQYNAFTTGKLATQSIKGGNTDEFYSKEGTLPKSKMLEDLHPDVAKIKWMNNRWHHYVDYSKFKSNRLIYKERYEINQDSEYGMILKEV